MIYATLGWLQLHPLMLATFQLDYPIVSADTHASNTSALIVFHIFSDLIHVIFSSRPFLGGTEHASWQSTACIYTD